MQKLLNTRKNGESRQQLPPKAVRNIRKEILLYSLAATSVAIETYLGLVRPWILHWGASAEEVGSRLEGDDLVAQPPYSATHAITIKAPVAIVWPWLVQLGQGRGGFYSYAWLENLLGCDIHNAEQILPQFQGLKEADSIRLFPPPTQALTPDLEFKVATIEPEQSLVLVTPGSLETNSKTGMPFASWAFIVKQVDQTTTRLIIRFRSAYGHSLLGWLSYQVLMEPIHFIMERKMLLGIKERAESEWGSLKFKAKSA
jgi:hypothetical protein